MDLKPSRLAFWIVKEVDDMGKRTGNAIISGIVPDRYTRPAPRVHTCALCDGELTSRDCRVGVVGLVVENEHGGFRVPVHVRCEQELYEPIGVF